MFSRASMMLLPPAAVPVLLLHLLDAYFVLPFSCHHPVGLLAQNRYTTPLASCRPHLWECFQGVTADSRFVLLARRRGLLHGTAGISRGRQSVLH